MAIGVALLLVLILITAALVLSEIAVVSSRSSRLVRMAEPTRFLSTVQVGIASIGILIGAIGRHYHTLGAPAMAALGRIPRPGCVFERGRCRFEVVDMDGNRVDRVLATLIV